MAYLLFNVWILNVTLPLAAPSDPAARSASAATAGMLCPPVRSLLRPRLYRAVRYRTRRSNDHHSWLVGYEEIDSPIYIVLNGKDSRKYRN